MKRPHADLAIKYLTDDTVKIQFKTRAEDSWEDCEAIPAFCPDFFYREKPKESPVMYYYRNYLATSLQIQLGNELNAQGIYPTLEDVLIALKYTEIVMEPCNEKTNTGWAVKVFDSILCAFDFEYENTTAADRISAVSMAIRNLEVLIEDMNIEKEET